MSYCNHMMLSILIFWLNVKEKKKKTAKTHSVFPTDWQYYIVAHPLTKKTHYEFKKEFPDRAISVCKYSVGEFCCIVYVACVVSLYLYYSCSYKLCVQRW